MTIGELAMKSGVPASTIRYWERIGVLPVSVRVSGQRRYGEKSVHQLAVLQLARACGFRLEEMRHLMNGFRPGTVASRRWRVLAEGKRQELKAKMAQLKAMQRLVDRVLDCQCAELAECGRMAASVFEAAH